MIYEKWINCFNDFLSVKYWHYFDIKVVKHFPWEHTVPWGRELPTSCDEPAMSYVPTAPAMDQSWPVPDSKPCADHTRSFWLAFGALRLFVTTFINTAWCSRKAKTILKSWWCTHTHNKHVKSSQTEEFALLLLTKFIILAYLLHTLPCSHKHVLCLFSNRCFDFSFPLIIFTTFLPPGLWFPPSRGFALSSSLLPELSF